MRVVIVSQHYPPEVTAASPRAQAFAEGLVARGHEVEVICEVPSHPAGVVEAGYQRRGERRERGGVAIHYVWVRTRPQKTTTGRLLLYGSFAASATMAGARTQRPDVVLVTSPPLPAAGAARAIARRHRVPWVMDVRDLWPEAAVVLGELRGRRAIGAAEAIERSLYRSAARIVTVTEPFRAEIESKLGSGERVEVIPNGTTPLWIEAGARPPDRGAAGLPEDGFVWAYGGNVGLAQGLEAAVEAAAELGEGFRLLVVGGGPRLQAVRELAGRIAPETEFRPLMPAAEAAPLLRAADALLVPLAPKPELSKFVPSKLFDCCALGVPVIVAAEGEAARLATEAGAALAVLPGNPGALAAAVRRLRDDPRLGSDLTAGAREFASANLRERGVERLESVLAGALGRAS